MGLKSYIYKKIKDNKFLSFFILLLAWLILEPLMSSSYFMQALLGYIFTLLIIIILYVISPNRTAFIVLSSLSILSAVFPTLNAYADFPALKTANLINELILNSLIAINIIWYTASKKVYSKDDIFAGVVAFLLIGACFADIYYATHYFEPNTIHFVKDPDTLNPPLAYNNLSVRAAIDRNEFLYFSYMTLTTVGYGDICPISYIAKRLCSVEACTGVLYLAVFIGRMILLYEEKDK